MSDGFITPPIHDGMAAFDMGDGRLRIVRNHELGEGNDIPGNQVAAGNLPHGPIPELQWPAMTMSFKLRDAKVAERLQPDARVIFEVKIEPEAGEYVIESIQSVDGSGQ